MDFVTAALSGGLVLPPGRDLSDVEARALSVPNPAHRAWKKLRQKYTRMAEPPKTLPGWSTLPAPHPWQGALLLPRHAPVLEGVYVHDRTVAPPAELLQSAFPLRDYQARAVKAWEGAGGQGVVKAPCGGGKTVIGCEIIARTPTPALVLVHTLDLAQQWQDRLQAQLGVQATLIGGGMREGLGRVCVATFQTLATMDPWALHRLGQGYGLVIVDEAHHVPAETFAAVMLMLPGRHRLGLTATPERADGLERLLWWHLSGIVARIEQEDLQEAGVVMAPEVHRLQTGWGPPDAEGDEKASLDWQGLIDAASTDPERNELILQVIHDLVADGRQVLVLVNRVEHATMLAKGCNRMGHKAAELTGRLSKTIRASVLDRASKRKLDVVTATSLADEGLDLPELDAVVLAMPTKASGRLEQKVGRVMRSSPGKRTPIVVDLVDQGPFLGRMATTRAALYRRLGATVGRLTTSTRLIA